VPPIAVLTAIGLRGLASGTLGPGSLGRWTGRAGAAVIAGLALAAGLPALTAYTREPAPVFRLFADMRSAGGPDGVVVAMHRRGHADTRRVRGWLGPSGFPFRLLDAPNGHEWLELVRYWREGGAGRTWLLADLRRTDLALIDPASQHANGHYDWSTPFAAGVVGGTRPGALDWVVIDGPPAWFLGQGWALSPEIAGVSNVDGKGPSRGGAVGWMRRSAAPRRLVIGGRNLGGPRAPVVRFALRLGDRVVDTWDVAPTPGFFARSITIAGSAVAAGGAETSRFLQSAAGSAQGSAAGSAQGFAAGSAQGFAAGTASGSAAGTDLEPFVVTASAADGSAGTVPTAIEQFGLQPLDAVQFAFADGWHEDELQPRTGLRWRWSSGESWLQVWPVDRDVRIRLVAESPLKTFKEAPIVTLTAGARELARATPGDAFAIDAIVPADVLRAANGRIVLRSSRTFVPADHVSAGDPRHGDRRALGLRVFEAAVTDANRLTPQ
jgi:hypothetical protein